MKTIINDFAINAQNFKVNGGEAASLEYSTLNDHDDNTGFRPVSRGLSSPFSSPAGWFCRSSGVDHNQDYHFVLKVQPFNAGGYECTLIKQDLASLAFISDVPRVHGKRELGVQDENKVQDSINRSKRKIRHLVKSMGADRLVTFTIRERDGDDYRTHSEWVSIWGKFTKLLKKNNVFFPYVATMEKHKKGNFHMHAATCVNVDVRQVRACWLAAVGRRSDGLSSGNIDVQYKRNLSVIERRARCARYISKYISKQSGSVEFNKKRYWASRHDLPEVRRYILNASTTQDAFLEISSMLALDASKLFPDVFFFSSGDGLFFSYDEKYLLVPPF